MAPSSIEIVGAVFFAAAVLHTFSTGIFERLAHRHPRHAGIWHLLGEVEVVFGFWALLLVFYIFAHEGKESATHYLDSRNFTEPLFVFAIMVIAGTRPILQFVAYVIANTARMLPMRRTIALYLLVMAVIPLLGSFITEPAAMTLAALMLRENILKHAVSTSFKYATLGALFVNISVGGTLTNFAAPPVLMVAGVWQWDSAFMMSAFGWRAVMIVFINAIAVCVLFRSQLGNIEQKPEKIDKVPLPIVLVHLAFLALVVMFSHHPAVFVGLLLFFLGFTQAYERHQDPLILKEALLVAFFLAGLVVLGGQQAWWLKPVLLGLSPDAIFYGAAGLTAITDNAALTYLASLVNGLSPEFKVSLVGGAVAGGGLTLIANAPNPAGAAILKGQFDVSGIRPGMLFCGAAGPTIVALCVFRWM